jgi:hypothetical protein
MLLLRLCSQLSVHGKACKACLLLLMVFLAISRKACRIVWF